VRADLDACQTKRIVAAFEFPDRQVNILHGECAETDETTRVLGDETCNVVIQQPGEVRRIGRFGPVIEHDGHGRQNLHADVGLLTVGNADIRIPAVRLDFPEQFAVLHHTGTARTMVLELNEAAVAVALLQVRPIFRKDMRVNVYFEHSGLGITVPHSSQVRFCSDP